MISLLSQLAIAQVYLGDPAVIIVGADPHYDEDQAVGAYRPLRVFGDAWDDMGAEAGFLLGDINSRTLNVPAPGGGNCNVGTTFSSTCPFPGALAQTWWDTDIQNHVPFPNRLYVLPGNHDSHPLLSAATYPYNEPDGWWYETINPLAAEGVIPSTDSTYSHYRVDINTGVNTWVVLFIGDENNHEDKSIGGRCSDDRYIGYRCSSAAMPCGALDKERYQWLDWQIGEAYRWNLTHEDKHFVVLTSHQPPPNTVVASWENEADDQVCPGVIMQTTNPHKRDLSYTPDRTDLDVAAPWDPAGRTPLQVADAWAGALIRWDPNSAPDPDWASDLLSAYPGTVKLWLAGHNHLPTPDTNVNGHGVRAMIGDTVVLALGPLTRARCTTPGYCKSSALKLVLNDSGIWTGERWNLDPTWTAGTCTTSAVKQATTPSPWLGIPLETN